MFFIYKLLQWSEVHSTSKVWLIIMSMKKFHNNEPDEKFFLKMSRIMMGNLSFDTVVIYTFCIWQN